MHRRTSDNSLMSAPLGEFDLIARYFTRATPRAVLGVGDDCAVLDIPAGQQLAVSTDMLIEGRHFLADVDPDALGHKTLAVNLSDLAAMGAEPLAFTLALALPEADPDWLEPFSAGLLRLAEAHGIELVGGDTNRGPRNLCVTVMGTVPKGRAMRRAGACVGDDLWVSGTPGDARLALGALLGDWSLDASDLHAVRDRLERPTPRVALGMALRDLATSAIDISDGLLGDLGHVLRGSGVGATVEIDRVPMSPTLAAQSVERRRACQLAGGDDYELLFTAPRTARADIERLASEAATSVARIGHIDTVQTLRLVDADGQAVEPAFSSFEHFRAP